MGELDLLKPTIERSLNGTIHFGRVSMKPGKPTTFASITIKSPPGPAQEKLLFALPGNPASAAVTFHLFALPALHQFSGHHPFSSCGLSKVRVVLEEDVKLDSKRNEYHRVVLSASGGSDDGRISARSTGGQRSSRIASFRGANGLLCLPVGEGWLRKGEMCEALVMGRLH
jgi:gephyrin